MWEKYVRRFLNINFSIVKWNILIVDTYTEYSTNIVIKERNGSRIMVFSTPADRR